MHKNNCFNIIAAGFALFSMFFGAGDLIWPLIVGSESGSQNAWTIAGFMVTAVSLPLLGLCSMMLFMGDYRAFFGRLGRWPGFVVLLLVQLILGPIGSIPRLFTLSQATLNPYLPVPLDLLSFSLISSAIIFVLAYRKKWIIDLIGCVLTPILLLSIAAIVYYGLVDAPAAPQVDTDGWELFYFGLSKGYNTLDMIASFIFAPFVMTYFIEDSNDLDNPIRRKAILWNMFLSSCLAALLLCGLYLSLSYVAAAHVPLLPAGTPKEQFLTLISLKLLGPVGGLFASLAVLMACLTTAIPLSHIFSDYLQNDICIKVKLPRWIALGATFAASIGIANLGFMGIADFLEPVLYLLCPALIVLCMINICEVLYGFASNRAFVYATFGMTTLRWLILNR